MQHQNFSLKSNHSGITIVSVLDKVIPAMGTTGDNLELTFCVPWYLGGNQRLGSCASGQAKQTLDERKASFIACFSAKGCIDPSGRPLRVGRP
jgi:hypothetical protein